MRYTTIIVSDIHMGMPESKYETLLIFLDKYPCQNLIINGDFIDEIYITFFGSWKQQYTDSIQKLISICKKHHTRLFYLEGNHEHSKKHISTFPGLTLQKDMIYTSHHRTYYICHGHQFDTLHQFTLLSYISFFGGNLIWLIYRICNILALKVGFNGQSLVTWMKRLAKLLIGGTTSIDKKIYHKAIEKGCDGIICGHFHTVEHRKIGNIQYLNSGEWVETGSALIEDEQGIWHIVYPIRDGMI